MMHVFGDYHMHTKYSDGRATVAEMRLAAEHKGLEEIAITDHGPRNIGVGIKNPYRLLKIKEEAKKLNSSLGVRVLVGVEANIIGIEGEIDVPEEIYIQLDMLLVGLHPYIFPKSFSAAYRLLLGNQLAPWFPGWRERVREVNTKAVVAALHRHPVKVLTHPGLKMDVDIRKVAKHCKLTGTAYEVNTGHMFQTVEEIKAVAETGTYFMLNSDAHHPKTVGKLEKGLEILQAAGVSADKILNVRH